MAEVPSINGGLEAAKVVLDRVFAGVDPYPKMTAGTMTLLRQGHKRTVQFLQVGDGSGMDLRLEIYAIEKGEKEEGEGGTVDLFPDLS